MGVRKKSKRARRSAEEWSRLVAAWRRSEQTAAELAAAHGVSRASLYGWSAELRRRRRQVSAESFVAVEVVGAAPEAPRGALSGAAPMELVAKSGRVIRLPGGVDATALAMVLEVAERC